MSTSIWAENLGCLGAIAKDDAGGACAGAEEYEGGAGMTIISSSLVL